MSDPSFVTVIIFAHGEDIKIDKATPEQFRTLRKFTVPGKCGHLSYLCKHVNDTIFDISQQLALSPHVPFTEKLKTLKTELTKHKFGEDLQASYECQSAEDKAENTSCPLASDWFSTSQVRYNHSYSFTVNDPAVPWELGEFGIWLVDGSPHILQREKQSRYYNPKNNITNRINIPPWDFDITLFELADRLKRLFSVKYVNFIDLSCRFREVDRSWKSRISSWFWSDDVPSAELREITPRAVERRIYAFNGIEIEIMDAQPPGLPPDWFYVRNLSDGTYAYVNPATHEMSVDFPDLPPAAPRPNIFVGALELEIVDPPKIKGIPPRQLPPGWEFVKILQSGAYVYINTQTGEMNPLFPGKKRSGGGSSKKNKNKNKNKKRTKTRKNK